MQTFETKTIREIALASPATTRVFEEYKIDYFCHGNNSFEDACKSVGADPEAVEMRLIEILEVDAKSDLEQIAKLPLADLTTYVVEKHHNYTKRELEHLNDLFDEVGGKHGESHPELSEVSRLFQLIRYDLVPHMMKEEIVLFPYIADLEVSVSQGIAKRKPHFGSVRNPIGMMSTEHDRVGSLLQDMRDASGDYAVPTDACPSFRALYSRLVDLERDLHQHIHLENNLLFIKAIDLDAQADILANN